MQESPKALVKSVAMFIVTLLSVFLVFGYQWTAGDPLSDSMVAWQSAQFAVALMTILLAHELGHYIVARRHGFQLSLPYFIPFPFAFGTLGAVISLKSLPKNRNGLLEMGAAGPIAGFVASVIAIAVGMPHTENHKSPMLIAAEGPVAPPVEEVSSVDVGWFESSLEWLGLVPTVEEGMEQMMILSDPLLMKSLGQLFLSEPLSPYAILHPFAFAGWVGCLLTAINMIPIGQLDGGHICKALFPKHARLISQMGLFVLFLGTFFWGGWFVWGGMLLLMGAWRGVPMPIDSSLSPRAKAVAVAAVISFAFSFMLRPIQIQSIPKDQIVYIDKEQAQ